ncbi:MAG: glycosyltransferase family 2 protein [Anaerobacillus sp.]|uniref:glycosyltransferase family 2 protein n=1 Tax=Anaerobacillus sp. TaxID=1872506 RepID=UPI00391CC13F
MNTLSLCMIVKNEEKVLSRCLESVKGLVDEMIIVDTGSEDKTIEVAKSYGANIYHYKWDNHFSNARNFSLEQTKTDWQLVLDADEYIVNDCKSKIIEFINSRPAVGRIKRIDKFVQNNEVRHSQAYISRIFPKNTRYNGRIHEQVKSIHPRKKLDVEVYHDGYYLKEKSIRNIALLIKEEKQNANDNYILYQLAKEYRITKDYLNANKYYNMCYSMITNSDSYKPNLIVGYIYNLILLKDFKKGLEIINNEYSFLKSFADFHFVVALFYMELVFSNFEEYSNFLVNIEKEYLYCIELGETSEYDSTLGTGSYLALYNLGVYYETMGYHDKAKACYTQAASYNYQPAVERLFIYK